MVGTHASACHCRLSYRRIAVLAWRLAAANLSGRFDLDQRHRLLYERFLVPLTFLLHVINLGYLRVKLELHELCKTDVSTA